VSRVAIYARVSKSDMESDNQLIQLRGWLGERGHTVVAEFIDVVSGGKGEAKRPKLAAMFDAAHRREFDIVAVYALDRLSREGMLPTVAYLQRLASVGVGFLSFLEPLLSTENELVRDIVLAVMAALAKQERVRISERTRAGLARVRRDGSKSGLAIGRPAVDPLVVKRLRAFRAEHPGMSVCGIAKLAKLDPKTVRKYLSEGVPAEPSRALSRGVI